MNKNRFFPKIVAGLFAVGGITAMVEHGSEKPPKEHKIAEPEKVDEKKDFGPEDDPQFCAEHPMEAELRTHKVPLDKMKESLDDAAELVRSHRYGDATNEEKYFAACRDTKRWAEIQKSIHFASEKTGVPERVLTAMGLIESQFKEDASRKDTNVYGPYQMTLKTAQDAAKSAKECFDFPIDVTSTDSLHETKTAVRLAALSLRASKKQYGQFGLAIMDYAGGHVGLEQKIKEAFPNVDLGEKDWADMERHHAAERAAQKERDSQLKRMSGGRITDVNRKAFRDAIHRFEAAGVAYTKAKNAWKQKRADLPKTLSDAGVTVLALYERAKAKGGEVPHSITYALALDDIAARAEKHAQDAKE